MSISESDKKDILAQYNESGFIILENVFSHDYCDTLINASSELEGAINKTYRPCHQAHLYDPVYLDAMKNETIVEHMSLVLDGQVNGLQTQFFYTKPGTIGFSLHQDNSFVEAKKGTFASCWLALCDVTPEMGGLVIYPCSNHEPILPLEETGLAPIDSQDINAFTFQTVVPDKYKPLSLSLSKGSAVIFDSHLVHGSNNNKSDKFRYVLLMTYIRHNASFRSGNTAKRTAISLE